MSHGLVLRCTNADSPVFSSFRDQDDLNVADQKTFCDLLGKLSGRPEENGLHVHPIYRDPNNLCLPDGSTDENM